MAELVFMKEEKVKFQYYIVLIILIVLLREYFK